MSVALTLAGQPARVAPGTDLLTACLGHGIEVPHFCWHEALGSAGACRLCAVHVTRPDGSARLEMACMTEAAEGLAVAPDHPEARRFRARVIEWLLAAHPHDCAVCEAGGACHLQDMAAASGHFLRRVRDPRRHAPRQDLGPFLTHETNRCIACYRCTRFYADFAGGRDFAVFGANTRVWFGRTRPGALDSPFAGNLAELCPTGVFNDRAWAAAYARPWDMERTPAICTRCAVGCNITLHARDQQLRKAEARFHPALNRHFLCDRGRFGPHAVHAPDRATALAPDTLARARTLVAGGAIGLGSPHASLEANLALRDLVGEDRFFAAMPDSALALTRRMAALLAATPARRASLADMAAADTVLLLATDLVAEAPMAALMLRQASRSMGRALAAAKGVPAFLDLAVRTAGEGRATPFILLAPGPTGLDDVATATHRLAPPALGNRAAAVAAVLQGRPTADPAAPAIAAALRAATAPVIVATAAAGPAAVEAAAAIAAALGPGAGLALLPAEANAFGLPLLAPQGGIESARAAAAAAGLPLLALEPAALPETATPVVRLDWLAPGPGLLVPVAAPEESGGLFVNFEGRAQESHAALIGPARSAPAALAALAGTPPPTPAALRARLAALVPALASLPPPPPQPIPRAAPGLSGRTANDSAGRLAEAVPPTPAPGEAFAFGADAAYHVAPPDHLRADWTGAGLHAPSSSYRAALGTSHPSGVLLPLPDAPAPPPAPPPDRPGTLEPVPALSPFAATPRDLASPWLAARLAASAAAPAAPALHPDDAARLGLAESAPICIDGRRLEPRLALDPALAPGTIRLAPEHMPATPGPVTVTPAP